MLVEDGAAGISFRARARGNGRAEGFHQGPAVWFLIVTHAHHEDLALEAEERTGHGERGPPLAGSGFSDQAPNASLLVIVGLRHGCVRLVRAAGADTLVLVIDPRRS